MPSWSLYFVGVLLVCLPVSCACLPVLRWKSQEQQDSNDVRSLGRMEVEYSTAAPLRTGQLEESQHPCTYVTITVSSAIVTHAPQVEASPPLEIREEK